MALFDRLMIAEILLGVCFVSVILGVIVWRRKRRRSRKRAGMRRYFQD